MINLSPNWLVVFGLALNFIGALLISIEAIGATQFMRAVEEEEKAGKSFAETSFISIINRTFIFVLVWTFTFFILWSFLDRLDYVEALLLAPLGFPLWKTLIKITELIQSLVKSFAPPRSLSEKGVFFSLIALLWGLAWGVIFLIVSIMAIIVRFGIDLPLRFFSEKVLGYFVMRILRKVDKTVQDMQKWYFKGPVFVGVVLLLGGFLYQIIGTIIMILSNVSR